MKSSLLGFGGPIAGAGGKATHKLPAPSPAALPRRGARPRGEAGSHGRSGHQVREGRAMDKREDPLPPKDDIITDDRERGADPDPRESDTELDEDDRLRPEFVPYVVTLANAGEHEAAHERAGRLPHPERTTKGREGKRRDSP